MSSAHPLPPRLETGMRLRPEEFLRIWEELPDVKHAELIDGVVSVASPVRAVHSDYQAVVLWWLQNYAALMPGLTARGEATWKMFGSVPQPDAFLCIRPEYGGQARLVNGYWFGAPELAAEVCTTTNTWDLGPKLALYQRSGVREYISVETEPKRFTWRILRDGKYENIEPDQNGVLKSETFPGLWLAEATLWQQDLSAIVNLLAQARSTPEYVSFAEQLVSRGTTS